MPIYEYIAQDSKQSCPECVSGLEHLEEINAERLTTCPKCGALLKRVISAPSLGRSASNLDDRAKSSGFHKLKKLGKGEYEKQY